MRYFDSLHLHGDDKSDNRCDPVSSRLPWLPQICLLSMDNFLVQATFASGISTLHKSKSFVGTNTRRQLSDMVSQYSKLLC